MKKLVVLSLLFVIGSSFAMNMNRSKHQKENGHFDPMKFRHGGIKSKRARRCSYRQLCACLTKECNSGQLEK